MHSEAMTRIAGLCPGDTVAEKYRVESVLGVGGMGVIYLARHLQLEGQVALKFLSAEFLNHPLAIERFHREARAAAKLKSEHVVRVFDVGTHTNGLPYMVMEFLEGCDLGELLRESGPLPVNLAADLFLQACSGVADAHRLGIIHRDLKPSNLFCVPRSDGGFAIKVVDFGISKVTGTSASQEEPASISTDVVGSPGYMSPEQMKSPGNIDRRTDIWSLGVALYECLTGKMPFPADSYAELCLKVYEDEPLSASAHGIELPPAFEAILNRCLAKDPEQRYATAGELAAALSEFAPPARRSWGEQVVQPIVQPVTLPEAMHATATVASQESSVPADSVFSGRRRRASWLLSASALASLGALGWLLLRDNPANSQVSTTVLSARDSSTGPAAAVDTAESSRPRQATPTVSVESGALPPLGPAVPKTQPTVPPAPGSVSAVQRSNLPRATPAPTPAGRDATSAGAERRATPEPSSAATATAARHRKPTAERDGKSSIWAR
jgi:eukaryotic-like serine/threonine-protein kinase